jgi:hypothetical protein
MMIMEPLRLEKTDETPKICLDANLNLFQFSDTSWPEDASKFYKPVFEWLEKYFNNPNPKTEIEFNFQYFNTASAKQLARILSLVEKANPKTYVRVKWFYDKDDTDMRKAGLRFSKLLKIQLDLVENN